MPGFKGSYIHALDEKGRVSFPARLKKYVSPEANDTFIITRGTETCIFMYPQDEWRELEKILTENLKTFNHQHRFLVRALLYWADEVTLDSQSRILIPKPLLEFAKIEKEVLFLGALDRIELWNPRIFEEYLSSQTERYEDIAETILGMRR